MATKDKQDGGAEEPVKTIGDAILAEIEEIVGPIQGDRSITDAIRDLVALADRVDSADISEDEFERITKAIERFAEGSVADTVERVAQIATEHLTAVGAAVSAEQEGIVGTITVAGAVCQSRTQGEDGVHAVFESGDRQFEIRHFCPPLIRQGGVYDLVITAKSPE